MRSRQLQRRRRGTCKGQSEISLVFNTPYGDNHLCLHLAFRARGSAGAVGRTIDTSLVLGRENHVDNGVMN